MTATLRYPNRNGHGELRQTFEAEATIEPVLVTTVVCVS
jgi:hypothetical protein